VSDATFPSDGIPPRPEAGRSTTIIDPVTPTTTPPTAAAVARQQERGTHDHSVLGDVTPERPRTHPVAYGALALAALALLFSLLGLRHDNGGYRQVKIGTNDCVIGRQAGTDVLYCRAPTVP
jgi:hypothetical protein